MDADLTKTVEFQLENAGKSEPVKAMKKKINSDPNRKSKHQEDLLEKFGSKESIIEAGDLVNVEHKPLYSEIVNSMEQLSENYA